MSKPNQRGGKKRGKQHLKERVPKPRQLGSYSPEPGVASPTINCSNCGDEIIIPLKLSEGVEFRMDQGAAFLIDCAICGTRNTYTAEEPTSIEVVTDGLNTILRSRRWVDDLVALRDTLTEVKQGTLSPEAARERLATTSPAAAALVDRAGLDVAKLAAVLAVVIAILAWILPDPLGLHDGASGEAPPPAIRTEDLLTIVRDAFDAGVEAERARQQSAPQDLAPPPPATPVEEPGPPPTPTPTG